MARAARGDAGWKPNRPSSRIVNDVRSFADAAQQVGHADPDDVSDYLRLASKAFLAGDHASARAVFEALLIPISTVDIDLGQHELVDDVLSVDAHTCLAAVRDERVSKMTDTPHSNATEQPEPVELVYGAPEFDPMFVERTRADEMIDARETWRTWGHVARASGMTWADFTDSYPGFVDEWGDEGKLRARWELPAEAVLDVLNEVIGESPASVAVDVLSKACPEALSSLEVPVEISSNYQGEEFARVSSIEDAEAFQRFLDSNGLSHIRLVRDDAFMRRLWA
jgi:hypothetical protein